MKDSLDLFGLMFEINHYLFEKMADWPEDYTSQALIGQRYFLITGILFHDVRYGLWVS